MCIIQGIPGYISMRYIGATVAMEWCEAGGNQLHQPGLDCDWHGCARGRAWTGKREARRAPAAADTLRPRPGAGTGMMHQSGKEGPRQPVPAAP